MGLLKHVLLPLFTLLDIGFFYKWLLISDYEEAMEWWGRAEPNEPPMTKMEIHFAHAISGAALSFAINNVAAIVSGNAFHRASALAIHVVFFTVDMWSYYTLAPPVGVPPPIIVFVVIGIIGLIIHSKEPGIFTKDKHKDEKKD